MLAPDASTDTTESDLDVKDTEQPGRSASVTDRSKTSKLTSELAAATLQSQQPQHIRLQLALAACLDGRDARAVGAAARGCTRVRTMALSAIALRIGRCVRVASPSRRWSECERDLRALGSAAQMIVQFLLANERADVRGVAAYVVELGLRLARREPRRCARLAQVLADKARSVTGDERQALLQQAQDLRARLLSLRQERATAESSAAR
mmetsp:Transcript_11737/g.34956  ORF Transcript_11737/g.34956 Transcript_11737/m.34956 type:complete len:209 (+) Transcript_11737:299-925(+)